jgi:hypothetical protein
MKQGKGKKEKKENGFPKGGGNQTFLSQKRGFVGF